MAAPASVTIRSYHVGFGDCYLLSFAYAQSEKHVLIDYGSSARPKGTPKSRMMDIANDITQRTGGKLDAVVATHRHSDHISGFATKPNGKGTGDVIRALKPTVVVQPWTEDPDLETEAEEPKALRRLKPAQRQVAALAGMHRVSQQVLRIANSSARLPRAQRQELRFHGENNLKNLSSVKNLMTMGKNVYIHASQKSGLEPILPGVKIHVLGPPTAKQHERVKNQAHRNEDEFWHLLGAAMRPAAHERIGGEALFPRYVRSRGPSYPVETRWLIYKASSMHAEQLLNIVRMMDDALNNTSVILLFEVGDKRLLFPGDAQIENWEFSLAQPATRKLLEKVDLYKVGHHGSLNATPKSLWKLFDNRSPNKTAAKRMLSLMSTMEGKHGDEEHDTEVPRGTLVSALQRETNHFSTQELKGPAFFKDFTIKFG